jgi:hypothetical protein
MGQKFTEADLIVWPHFTAYFIDLLNGDASLKSMQEDLASLVGSRFDPRVADHKSSQGGK